MDIDVLKASSSATTVVDLAITVLVAVAFWTYGRWPVGCMTPRVPVAMSPKLVDSMLTPHRRSAAAILLNIALLLGSLAHCGIQMTSMTALLVGVGVIAVAVWYGLLGNFAAAAHRAIASPFKGDDAVSVVAVVGLVRALGSFDHAITAPANALTIAGHHKVFGHTVQSPSVWSVRRVGWVAQWANGHYALGDIRQFKAAVARIPRRVKAWRTEVNRRNAKLDGCQILVRRHKHTDRYAQACFDAQVAILRRGKDIRWPAPWGLHCFKQVQA